MERLPTMERSPTGKYLGFFGAALLLVCYVRMLGFEFMTPNSINMILAFSMTALTAFVFAGRLSRRRWYWGALFAVISVALLFAKTAGLSLLIR